MQGISQSACRPVIIAALGLILAVSAAAQSLAADPRYQGAVTARVKPNPLELHLLAPDGTRAGQFVLGVEVHNRGAGRLRDVDVTLYLPEVPCLELKGPVVRHRGLLGGEDVVSVSWRLDVETADAPCDAVLVVAKATATDEADGQALSAESRARLLTFSYEGVTHGFAPSQLRGPRRR